MMNAVSRCSVLMTTIGVLALPVRSDEAAPGKLTPAQLETARTATRDLANELEQLQEDIISDLSKQKERTLYRHADAVLAAVAKFEAALKTNGARKELYAEFGTMDRAVHDLLKAVRTAAPDERALQRAAKRVSQIDDELHYALGASDPGGAWRKQLLERQALALATAAHELERTADYAFGTMTGQAVLQGNLAKLSAAADQFQKSVAAGTERTEQQRGFEAVNRAWEQAIQSFQTLKPQDSQYLLRGATRIDQLQDRLFRMLEMKGERARLTIRS